MMVIFTLSPSLRKVPQVFQLELKVVLLDLQPPSFISFTWMIVCFFLASAALFAVWYFELAVVHNPGDGRHGFRRDLDQIELLSRAI